MMTLYLDLYREEWPNPALQSRTAGAGASPPSSDYGAAKAVALVAACPAYEKGELMVLSCLFPISHLCCLLRADSQNSRNTPLLLGVPVEMPYTACMRTKHCNNAAFLAYYPLAMNHRTAN
jgi:hypothetical protein